MRRLTSPGERERGAVAIFAALALLVVVGGVGLAVDVGASYAKKQELQNGADAAALAVAHECAVTGAASDCFGDAAIAQDYSVVNVRNEQLSVNSAVSYPQAHQVRVEVTGQQTHWFMAALGSTSSDVTVDATAAWGPPEGGAAMLPLTFSLCSFNAQGGPSGAVATIFLPKHEEPDSSCIDEQSGQVMPSGFGYIGDGPGVCGAEVQVDGWVPSQGGNVPQGCTATDFSAMVGEVILLPIYDGCRTGKSNVDDCTYDPALGADVQDYHIYAFAAFEFHSYYLSGTVRYGDPSYPCGGQDRCVRGAFVEYVDLDSAFDYGSAPDLGASTVLLIN